MLGQGCPWTSEQGGSSRISLLEAEPLLLQVVSVGLCLCDLLPESGHVAAFHISGSANQKHNMV